MPIVSHKEITMWDDDYEEAREEYYEREAEWYGYDNTNALRYGIDDSEEAEWARDYDRMRY